MEKMESLDLDSGIDLEQLSLPISNTENKILEGDIQLKEKDINVHDQKINEHRDRVQAIKDHLKNVIQELQHTEVITDFMHCKIALIWHVLY